MMVQYDEDKCGNSPEHSNLALHAQEPRRERVLSDYLASAESAEAGYPIATPDSV